MNRSQSEVRPPINPALETAVRAGAGKHLSSLQARPLRGEARSRPAPENADSAGAGEHLDSLKASQLNVAGSGPRPRRSEAR